MKYKIEKYEKPIIKSYKDIKKFEVVKFEYGDYDNCVCAIILKITPDGKNWLEVEFATIDGAVSKSYCPMRRDNCIFEIIGTAKGIEKEK